jgi:hypothetical protein
VCAEGSTEIYFEGFKCIAGKIEALVQTQMQTQLGRAFDSIKVASRDVTTRIEIEKHTADRDYQERARETE